MKLNRDQIALLTEMVDRCSRLPILRDDLLDHLCCDTEWKMARGMSFSQASREALNELAPEGIEAIETETLLLLNQNTIRMKKVLIMMGGFCASLTIAGSILKAFHLEWANASLIFGIGGVILFFFPFLLTTLKTSDVWQRRLTLSGIISGLLIGLGICLRLWHVPGANLTLLVGGLATSLVFIPLAFYQLYRRSIPATA